MLRRSYAQPTKTAKTEALAKEVTLLVVHSNVTYKEALDALDIASDMLEEQTRPIIVQQAEPE